MVSKNSIINPVKGKNSPDPGSLSVLAGIREDLFYLKKIFKFDENDAQRIFGSRLYIKQNDGKPGISLTGPMVGAPYAVMILENLIAWGVESVLFIGWCGAISEHVKIGDIIIPTSSFIEEGTSPQYDSPDDMISKPSVEITEKLLEISGRRNIPCHEGKIWTTDAIYRETEEKVKYHQDNNVLAVEMETSALFTVAGYRDIKAGAILIVSDELSELKWRPGFRQESFKKGRHRACDIVKRFCREVEQGAI